MEWFENWFNSPYYHILYKNRDTKEAEHFINNLISHLKLKKGSRILDIACGKGRHAMYLNKKGMDVIGIDLSVNSINTAKQNETKTLQFKVHDMRKPFKKNTFDVSTNLFTSFGYFKKDNDEQQAMNSMSQNLKKEGLLIIDFMNVKKIIGNLIANEEKKINNINFKIQRYIHNNRIIKEIRFSKKKQQYHFTEEVKALQLIDFSNLINNAGMKIINLFGNYTLDEFNANSSERLILICKK